MAREFSSINPAHNRALRVWIELESPSKVKRDGDEIAAAANAMLQRLGVTWEHFRWSGFRAEYQLVDSASGTYTSLRDRGEWFNLEQIAEGK